MVKLDGYSGKLNKVCFGHARRTQKTSIRIAIFLYLLSHICVVHLVTLDMFAFMEVH